MRLSLGRQNKSLNALSCYADLIQYLEGIELIQMVKGCVIFTECVAHFSGQIVNKDGSFKFFM